MDSLINEPEPESSEVMFCPHCAAWYSRVTAKSKLEARITSGVEERVVEVFYCRNKHEARMVELIDAHNHGCLTPWEQWKRDHLIAEMDSHLKAANRIREELKEYYMYDLNQGY